MRNFAKLLSDYHHQHSNKINNLSHQVGIPMIYLGTFMFLGWFQLMMFGSYTLDFGWLLAAALGGFYCTLDIKTGLICFATFIVFKFMAGVLGNDHPTLLNCLLIMIFLGGGIALLIYGHQQQGNKPSVQDYVFGVLNAPMVIIADLVKEFGL